MFASPLPIISRLQPQVEAEEEHAPDLVQVSADDSPSKMPTYRYSRGPQEIDCRPDRNYASEDPAKKVVSLSPYPSSLVCSREVTEIRAMLINRYTVYKDHVSLRDYEINDGMSLEMY